MRKKCEASSFYGQGWKVWTNDDGTMDYEVIQVVLLHEIRDEIVKLNRLLHCDNFIGVPQSLKRIARNTTKKRRTK